MSNKRKLSVLTLGLLIVGMFTSLAYASPSQEVWTYYYSDSSLTQEVGMKLNTTCYGVVNVMIWGTTSSHSVKVSEPGTCGSPAPSNATCFFNGWQTTCPSYICDTFLVESCN